jgi:hypothetical protein
LDRGHYKNLNIYISSEEKQGTVVVTSSWKDSVISAILFLVNNREYGKWNWEYNHYLGHHNIYPCIWRNSLREVYTSFAIGQPASDYVLAYLYNDRGEIRTAYGKVK